MRLHVDRLEFEVDGPFYIDVILSADELDRIRSGEMVHTSSAVKGIRFYAGVILKQRKSRYEKEETHEEGSEES